MMILASTIASQALSEFNVMLGGALNVGITPVEIKEIVYQAVPYIGIAKVLDFSPCHKRRIPKQGNTSASRSQSTTPDTRYEKGLAVQKQSLGNDREDV